MAFFCVGNDLLQNMCPKAAAGRQYFIDKSYYFRNHADVPLIIPEVNHQVLGDLSQDERDCQSELQYYSNCVGLKPFMMPVGISSG